ncbi:MAG: aldo/keto reductase [Pseudomonadota bacterium]|nr:aldo/keto reductase [Pseudomonadota bacterium]
MKKNPIGETGLFVTEVGFGAGPLGGMPDTYGHDVDEDTARATVRAIFDGPVNLLDTSRNYGMGRSEARIGAVIRERGGLPQGFVLSTKLDRDMETGRFDAARARRSLEESLAALGVDKVGILHLHDPEHGADVSEVTRKGGALEALFRFKQEGLATAVGLAMGRMDLFTSLIGDWPFDVVMNHNRYTLLNRSAGPAYAKARGRGMAVFNAAPYAGGVLAKGSAKAPRITYQEASEAALAPVRRVEAICERRHIAVGAAALQFSIRAADVASTIVGVSRPQRVRETLDWASAAITEAAWRELDGLAYDMTDPEAERHYTPG